MNRPRASIAVVLALASHAAGGADVTVRPPADGGFAVVNAANNLIRFRVGDDGMVDFAAGAVISKGGDRFLHNTGTGNTFLGILAGNPSMTGVDNFAAGYLALRDNTTGESNTAVGRGSLLFNTTGRLNTSHGTNALHDNLSGASNSALGNDALFNNTTGNSNTAMGASALKANTTSGLNTAVGSGALGDNTGIANTAVGAGVLAFNTEGTQNTAIGYGALSANVTGSYNVGLGEHAGFFTTGSRNILLGNYGEPDEDGTIRIGDASQTRTFISGIRGKTTVGTAIAVVIDSNGQLGTVSSSASTKDDIASMGDATDALMQLRPVTFHYKADQDPAGRTLQYGLVAEEVAEVYPGLVARSNDGQVETVMYQFLPSMLLNEVQKQRRTIERLEAKLAAIEQRLATPREPQ